MFRLALTLAVVFGFAPSALAQRGQALEPPRDAEAIEIEVTIVHWDAKGRAGDNSEGADVDVKALEKSGQITTLQRFRMTTLDQLKVTNQIAERQPTVTGVIHRDGNTQRAITYQQVGTMISATPRIDGQRVLVALKVERSGLDSSDGPLLSKEGADEPVRASSMGTMTAESTLSIRPGETAVLMNSSTRNGDAHGGQAILVTARVLD